MNKAEEMILKMIASMIVNVVQAVIIMAETLVACTCFGWYCDFKIALGVVMVTYILKSCFTVRLYEKEK